MKVWIEKAGDHSANLRIVGTFKSESDAQKAVDRINGLIEVAQHASEKEPGDDYAKEVLAFIMQNNISTSPQAVESCTYHYPVERVGKSIEIKTDELEIQLFIEAFISCGGKIEIYSLDDYK